MPPRESLTHLVTFGISTWQDEDGALSTREAPSDPEVNLFLSGDMAPEDIASGTEVWLLDASDA
jgi:hypothetical protein